MELSKYITSQSVEVLRSSVKFAEYNPRTLSREEKANIKRGIKKFGLVGGLVVNKRTGMTVVSGHQRLTVMDEINGYPEKDYGIRVDLIDVDEKTEKELNILLNNPNAQGKWDYDALREMIPDIDYKAAGLTDEDLDLIGVDFLLQSEEENRLADNLEDMMIPVKEVKEEENARKAEERAERVAHMKEVKAQVRAEAQERAENMEAYVMLSFGSFEAKKAFCLRFDIDPYEKFVKGEVFSDMVERSE